MNKYALLYANKLDAKVSSPSVKDRMTVKLRIVAWYVETIEKKELVEGEEGR